MAPQPLKRISVRQYEGQHNHVMLIDVVPDDDAAAAWVEQNVPRYGKLESVTGVRRYQLHVTPFLWDPNEVKVWIEQMGER